MLKRVIRAQLLQDSSSSERQLVEPINYNLLYHCFIRLISDDKERHHSSSSTNRAQLLEHDVVMHLFEAVVNFIAWERKLLS